MRVAVVGAGITGLVGRVWTSPERGAEVVVHERAGIGAEASGVQPGGVRQQWSTRVNCILARESIALLPRRAATPRGAHRARRSSHADTSSSRTPPSGRDALAARGRPAERARHPVGAPRPGRARRASSGDRRHGRDGRLVLRRGRVLRPAAGGRRGIRRGSSPARRRDRALGRRPRSSSGRRAGRSSARRRRGDRGRRRGRGAGYDAPRSSPPSGVDLPIAKEARYLLLSDPIADRLLEPLVVSAERHFAAKHLRSGRVLASDLAADGDPERGCGGMACPRQGERAPVPARPRVRHLPARRGGLLRRHPRPPAADRARSRADSGWPPASAVTAS